MSAGYLIAFGGKPRRGFLDSLTLLAGQDGVDIQGAVLTDGPGCANLAILLPEPNEAFVNQLTMVLMPAKWEPCTDSRLVVGSFIDEVTR
jgi:hypothetical protein